MEHPLKAVFDKEARWIQVYMGVETVDDPFEKNVSKTFLNPLSIRAIVTDLIASQIQWKMPGIKTQKAKDVLAHKKDRALLEQSQRIEIRNSDGITEQYLGWRENGKMQIREEGEYLRVYLYSKPS